MAAILDAILVLGHLHVLDSQYNDFIGFIVPYNICLDTSFVFPNYLVAKL